MSNWVVGNRYLNTAEMQNNAQIIYDRLKNGWTKNAICALLANMQSESNINPGIWEGLNEGNLSGGFGLVQWTPATKYRNWHDSYFGDTNYTDGNKQISRIIYEVNNGIEWGTGLSQQGLNFLGFTKSTLDPYTLAVEFMLCYEKPAPQYSTPYYQAIRGNNARAWWDYFGGGDFGEGGEGGGTVDPDPPSDTVYNITIDISGSGVCRTDVDEAYPGDTVTIIPTPGVGYYTDEVIIYGEDGETYSCRLDDDGVYRFTMPNTDVEISVIFKSADDPGGDEPVERFPIWLLFKLSERRF